MHRQFRLPHRVPLASCLLLLFVSHNLHAQAPQPQPAPLTGPGLIVTYLEAPPAKAAALTADLKAYAAQIESSPAKPVVTILSELGRPNRLALLEQWPDLSSPAFAQAEHLLTANVQPDLEAPMDRRVNHPATPPLSQPPSKAFPPTSFFVLMHLDIGRDDSGEAPKAIQAQRDALLASPGALGYEVAVQDQHTNHFALCELWKSRAAYEAYIATAPAEDFRRRLATLIGSPFDDRFYTPVGH